MTLTEFEERLHQVWLTAYSNGLSLAHHTYTVASSEAVKIEDHAAEAIKHAEAVVAAYKKSFETYVEKVVGNTK